MNLSRMHKVLITFLIYPLLSGCLPLTKRPESSYYSAQKQTSRLTPENFQEEIKRLEERTGEEAGTSAQAKSYLQLALLHMDHRNPARNYSRALESLEKYVALEERAVNLNDLQNWIAVLREMERLHGGKSSFKKTGSPGEKDNFLLENKKLRDEISGLRATVEKLKDDIEKLNALDLELEKKRRINR